jgi:hypothetical protein
MRANTSSSQSRGLPAGYSSPIVGVATPPAGAVGKVDVAIREPAHVNGDVAVIYDTVYPTRGNAVDRYRHPRTRFTMSSGA